MKLDHEQKVWIRDISEGKIRNVRDAVVLSGKPMVPANPEWSDTSDLTSGRNVQYTIVENDIQQSKYVELPTVDLKQLIVRFRALVAFLDRNDLVIVMGGNKKHLSQVILRLHPEQAVRIENEHFIDEINELNKFIDHASPSLPGNDQTLSRENYYPLPSLAEFIRKGYKTQEQVQHREMTDQAEEALMAARVANETSRNLAYWSIGISLFAALVSIGLTIYTIMNPTTVKTEANNPLHIRSTVVKPLDSTTINNILNKHTIKPK